MLLLKNYDKKNDFDSFGLILPKEVIRFLKSPIMYSTYQIQQFNNSNNKWSLFLLDKLNNGNDYIDVILLIINSKTY